jgi:aldehyde dehydrogenase (NAD+)
MLTTTRPANSARPEPIAETMRIAGERVRADRTLDVRNPYTGELAGTVPRAGVDDIRRAFAAARAYKPRLTRYERYEICRRAASLIESRAARLSDLITAECGICKKDSLYEVGRARDVFTFAGNAALTDDGQVFSCDLTPHGKSRKVYTLREPLLGVISAITPFNHPLNPGGAQDRAIHCDQQSDGAEAHREDAALGHRARGHPLRGRPAAADVLRGHGRSA